MALAAATLPRGPRPRADMDWDQAVAYTITQATQALGDLGSETRP
jgi:hypothetical protein